jgi:hypothetical protein
MGSSLSVLPYKLMRPVPVDQAWCPPVGREGILSPRSSSLVISASLQGLINKEVALDVETRGTHTWDPEHCVVGVGLAWETPDGLETRYVPYQGLDNEAKQVLWEMIELSASLAAHNELFDMGWCREEIRRLSLDVELPWGYCTYGLLRLFAGEDFPGQSWGLKAAMTELLRWPASNEEDLDHWLISHGYVKGLSPRKDETAVQFSARCRARLAEESAHRAKGGEVESPLRPDKSEMWRAPHGILGHYCMLDAAATLQLLDLFRPLLEQFPEVLPFHREVFLHENGLLADATRTGILVDRPALEAHAAALRDRMAAAESMMRDRFEERIAQVEREALDALRAKEPPRYKKQKVRQEPAKFLKDGVTLSKNWEKWATLECMPPEETKPWLSWRERMDAAEAGEIEDLRWSPSSRQRISDLLYGEVLVRDIILRGETPPEGRWSGLVRWRAGDPWESKSRPGTVWVVTRRGDEVELERTDSGLPPVDGDLFALLPPDQGEPLALYFDSLKELGYATAWLDHSALDGRLHAGWSSPGTSTLRLAGKDPNLQQAPKSLALLATLIPDDGMTWVEMDFAALEPHVAAELTRDPALLELYGPEARPHDLYLFNASHYAVLSETVAPVYPRGDRVTKEAVAAAKVTLKKERGMAKPVTLGCIAEGTPVLVKGRGLIPIEQVMEGELVWDGEEWVSQGGALYKGTRTVLGHLGVQMTSDHKVLTYEGWKVQEGTDRAQCIRPEWPRASWSDLWGVVRSLFRGSTGQGTP